MLIDFIKANWDSILVVLVMVFVLVLLVRNGYKKSVRKILFYLVTQAEIEFGNGTGELKYALVATWLYERIPLIMRIILTEKTIDDLIEQAVIKMKEYLAENENARLLISDAPQDVN